MRRHDTHSPSRAFTHRNRCTVAALVLPRFLRPEGSSAFGTVENRISCPATKDRVPHPSRFLRRVGCHCSSPEALPRDFCLSHPSQRARRMGHPILCGRARNTRLYHSIRPWFSSPWVSRRLMGTRLKPCPSTIEIRRALQGAEKVAVASRHRPSAANLSRLAVEAGRVEFFRSLFSPCHCFTQTPLSPSPPTHLPLNRRTNLRHPRNTRLQIPLPLQHL
jgi:hypothetical protein